MFTQLFWIIVDLVADFLVSIVMRGGGYGVVGDIVVGIVGALIGGFIMNASGGNILYSILIAFIGAPDRRPACSRWWNAPHYNNVAHR